MPFPSGQSHSETFQVELVLGLDSPRAPVTPYLVSKSADGPTEESHRVWLCEIISTPARGRFHTSNPTVGGSKPFGGA